MKMPQSPTEGNEAICFTAGLKANIFSCGLIHAYLASDRKAPAVAAGISLGALNAAALQRCYKELEDAAKKYPGDAERCEIARWKWFREYMELLVERPLSVIWDGLPDQSDFYAELPPVKDPAAALFKSGEEDGQQLSKFQREAVQRDFTESERLARRELFLYVKLGRWISTLPISLAEIADLLVKRVRAKEAYPSPKILRIGTYWLSVARVGRKVISHALMRPEWFPEYKFSIEGSEPVTSYSVFGRHIDRYRSINPILPLRPLFGWPIYLSLLLGALVGLSVIAAGLYGIYTLSPVHHWVDLLLHKAAQLDVESLSVGRLYRMLEGAKSQLVSLGTLISSFAMSLLNFVLYLLAPASVAFVLWFIKNSLGLDLKSWWKGIRRNLRGPIRELLAPFLGLREGLLDLVTEFLKTITNEAAKSVQLEKHIVHPYHLRTRLTKLFGNGGLTPTLDSHPFPVLLVTAPLEQFQKDYAAQLWARNGTPLTDALCASLAIPGLFSPLEVAAHSGSPSSSGRSFSRGTLDWRFWVQTGQSVNDPPYGVLNLVDGSVVRKNPIPSLFRFLKEQPAIGDRISSETASDPRVHVMFGQPLEPKQSGIKFEKPPDIVDVAATAMRLQTRRDTELEIRQSNFTSQIECEIRDHTKLPNSTSYGQIFPIFSDAIAPEEELSFGSSPIVPEKGKLLSGMAAGCRRTLEKLYQSDITRLTSGTGSDFIPCSTLLATVAQNRPSKSSMGLPEICGACSQKLRVCSSRTQPSATTLSKDTAKSLIPLAGEITGQANTKEGIGRVVFVASGGVFRGSFHAGMVACMLTAQIRPQLIVGASVGTLMGGALGAILSTQTYDNGILLLSELVNVFLHVDEQIAFTKVFKNAVREIGIRGKSIKLSPRQLGELIRAGARSDPAFAIVGAPSPLLDAISDLFMIPHEETKTAASRFISGKVSQAVSELLIAIKQETLRRLEVQSAVIGTSLLDPTARRLLNSGCNLSQSQPFSPHIAFLCTTTDLNREAMVVLGGSKGLSYDFVEAALCSSAFPAVFSPRRASNVFPGVGDPEQLYSDGGMFDNLPFLPAIGALGQIQTEYANSTFRNPIDYLKNRHANPDLFLVGSLDVQSTADPNRYGPYDDLISITNRGKLLENNVKIDAFLRHSNRVHYLLDDLLAAPSGYQAPSSSDFVNGVVDAAVMPIFPSDANHLNPTFAFCASTGFRKRRVIASIADGCFQTFREFVTEYDNIATGQNGVNRILTKSIGALRNRRIPEVSWSEIEDTQNGICPFFQHSTDVSASHSGKEFKGTLRAAPFQCPFHKAWQLQSANDETADAADDALDIYKACIGDKGHRAALDNALHNPNQGNKITRAASGNNPG